MADIDQYMNIIKEVLVDIFNEYSPTKLPKLKKNLKNMVNMLRAKLHRNRSIIAVSFLFLSLFEDVKRMQLMYTDLLRAVNYSRNFLSVKQKLATPKYICECSGNKLITCFILQMVHMYTSSCFSE